MSASSVSIDTLGIIFNERRGSNGIAFGALGTDVEWCSVDGCVGVNAITPIHGTCRLSLSCAVAVVDVLRNAVGQFVEAISSIANREGMHARWFDPVLFVVVQGWTARCDDHKSLGLVIAIAGSGPCKAALRRAIAWRISMRVEARRTLLSRVRKTDGEKLGVGESRSLV